MVSTREVPRIPDGEVQHHSHWGAFRARAEGTTVHVTPQPGDPDPSAILESVRDALAPAVRIGQPMIRKGWLEQGPGPTGRRGRDPWIAVSWDEAIELVAAELARVREKHGSPAIFGGSYGWASAGRVHHAQSQIHRFLNLGGGYTRSVNSYSSGAGEVILPHIFASSHAAARDLVTWDEIRGTTELIVAFGGMSAKNHQVEGGGPSRHRISGTLRDIAAGTQFVLVSPLRDDLLVDIDARWLAPRPMTDVAMMLGLAHTLATEGLADEEFLDRYCTGYPAFRRYLLGETDGQPKDADWAADICLIDAETIRGLAREMAAKRTLVTVSYSLQRAEHGEQPIWMAVTLAAMLGQIGLPGGGFMYSMATFSSNGFQPAAVRAPSFPQGQNNVKDFIPVARISDLLLHPGEPFDYNGQHLTFPDIRLVYWAGGNPFHHHQDLNRLREAFGRPDTIIVHEPFWTATARHADIVLPCTLTLERNDIGNGQNDPNMVAMHRVAEPYGQSKDDYAIFSLLADRLGYGETFTQGRTADDWLRHIYDGLRTGMADAGVDAPTFEEFWETGELALPMRTDSGRWLRAFRADPDANPLTTPSGRIEILSETIASFGYDDCPGHPTWIEKVEWLGSPLAQRFPLQMVSNQPKTRLHSQLDFGRTSVNNKIQGREAATLHPADAAARGIVAGDTIRIFNDRGACYAGARLSDGVMPGVIVLPTGAWYDPDLNDPTTCLHGNPNAVTRDVGTSRLAQGSTGQLTLVDVEKATGPVPPPQAFVPPAIETR